MAGPWHHTIDRDQLGAAIAALTGVGVFLHSFALWRRARRIEDTPRSLVRSMPLGRVELHGVAREIDGVRAPISGRPCAWFRYRIERRQRRGSRSEWVTVDSGDSSDRPFHLEDDTGRVRVDPAGARFEVERDLFETNPQMNAALVALCTQQGIDLTSAWLGSASRLRVSEWRLEEGDAVFVTGVAQARHGLLDERRFQIAARLAEAKQDAATMAALDVDADGHVSVDEWEALRRRVVQEVDAVPVVDRVVVARDCVGQTDFVISDRGERALVRSLRWRFAGELIGGVVLAVAALAWLLARFGRMGGS